jgi:hypothetical protein
MFRNMMQVPTETFKIGAAELKSGGSGMIAKKWHQQPPEQASTSGEVIDLRTKLYNEVRAAYWKVIACEYDGMQKEVEAARQECLKAAQQLRRTFDSHPTVGPDEADAMIAWAVHYARKDFEKDLQHQTNWRDRLGRSSLPGEPPGTDSDGVVSSAPIDRTS